MSDSSDPQSSLCNYPPTPKHNPAFLLLYCTSCHFHFTQHRRAGTRAVYHFSELCPRCFSSHTCRPEKIGFLVWQCWACDGMVPINQAWHPKCGMVRDLSSVLKWAVKGVMRDTTMWFADVPGQVKVGEVEEVDLEVVKREWKRRNWE